MAFPSLGSLRDRDSAYGGVLRMVMEVTESESHIHRRCGPLEDPECADNGRRHAIVGLVDSEVLQGAFGLGAPIFV